MGSELLEETFLGEPAELTRDDVVARADVPLERSQVLWRALGFPDAEPGEPAFTQADVEALRLAARLEADQFVGDGMAELLARVMGQSMNRLAEALMEMLSDLVADDEVLMKLAAEEPREGGPGGGPAHRTTCCPTWSGCSPTPGGDTCSRRRSERWVARCRTCRTSRSPWASATSSVTRR